jgi:hypothetical protein
MAYLYEQFEKLAAGEKIENDDLVSIVGRLQKEIPGYEKAVQEALPPDSVLTPFGAHLVNAIVDDAAKFHGGATLGTETDTAKGIQRDALRNSFSSGHVASMLGGGAGGLTGAGLGALIAGKERRALGALLGGTAGSVAGSAVVPELIKNKRVADLVAKLSANLSGSAHGKIRNTFQASLKEALKN